MASTQIYDNVTHNITSTTVEGNTYILSEIYLLLLQANYVVSPIFTAFGIVGNIAAFLIFSRARFSSMSFSIYTRFLAVADIIYLCINLNLVFSIEPMYTLVYYTEWACKLWAFLYPNITFISSWMLVLISTERLIAILFPFKSKLWCTRKGAVCVSCTLCFIMFVFNSHIPVMYNTTSSWTGECGPKSVLYGTFVWISSLMMYSFLPAVIIIVCNTLIIYELVKRAKFRKRATASNTPKGSSSDNITIMLLVNSILFVLLTLPVNLYRAVYHINIELFVFEIDLVFSWMATLNHTINFVLYAACGSQFREELCSLICPKRFQEGDIEMPVTSPQRF